MLKIPVIIALIIGAGLATGVYYNRATINEIVKPTLTLPRQRPQDVYVSYNTSGGMMPVGSRYYISEKESYVETYNGQLRNKTDFNVTPAEMDSLYQMLIKNKFDYITSHEELIYDRGGSDIAVGWAAQTINISNSGMQVINTAWYDTYSAVEKNIGEFVAAKLNSLRKSTTLILDSSLTANGKKPYVSIDTLISIDGVSTTTFPSQKELQLLPGEYAINATVTSPVSGSNKTNVVKLDSTFTIPSSSVATVWQLSFVNNALKFKRVQ